jgi:hypothetical protein
MSGPTIPVSEFFIIDFQEFTGAVFTGLNDGFADIQSGGNAIVTTLNTTQNNDVVVAGMFMNFFTPAGVGSWPQTVSTSFSVGGTFTLENYQVFAQTSTNFQAYGYDSYCVQPLRGSISPEMSWSFGSPSHLVPTLTAAAFSTFSGTPSFYQAANASSIANGQNPLTLTPPTPLQGDLLVVFPWYSVQGGSVATITDNAGGSLGNYWQSLIGVYGGSVFWTVNSQLPIVTTQQPTIAVPLYSVTANGTLQQPGWNPTTVEGFVWDVVSHSLPGNVAPASSLYPNFVSTSGSFSAPNTFSQLLTGLPSSSTIFIRAVAMSSYGWSYGNEVTTITLSNSPCLIQYGVGY